MAGDSDKRTGNGQPGAPQLLVITGMSGAGRTRAASVLEDRGWYVVDNLPPQMLRHLAQLVRRADGAISQLAVVVDVRSREFFARMVSVLADLRSAGFDPRVLFLDASDEVLVRRFEHVRRPHPLQDDATLLDGITRERLLLAEVNERADVVIDTSDMPVTKLADAIVRAFATETDTAVRLTVMSFGFKYGIPLDADHVMDVRFLTNPFWEPDLRNLNGLDAPVSDFVLNLPGARTLLTNYATTLEPVFAGYTAEHKQYAIVALGCTGGKHRSVALAVEFADQLQRAGHHVRVVHRDLGRE